MTRIEGQALTPDGFRPACVTIEDERIRAVEAAPATASHLILPGFVDLHCHGGGGADVMEAGEAARLIARTHARAGTTAFLATTMTAPLEEIERALSAADRAARDPGVEGAATSACTWKALSSAATSSGRSRTSSWKAMWR
jgi:N-acetylglucosamine-6-phosphate deacetylase